ncbi:MAG: hypothetical protein IEMM0008_1249 [bacterium]|nr:MAG: hypothetical protein IEMM0008_1249 [bacterium]
MMKDGNIAKSDTEKTDEIVSDDQPDKQEDEKNNLLVIQLKELVQKYVQKKSSPIRFIMRSLIFFSKS